MNILRRQIVFTNRFFNEGITSRKPDLDARENKAQWREREKEVNAHRRRSKERTKEKNARRQKEIICFKASLTDCTMRTSWRNQSATTQDEFGLKAHIHTWKSRTKQNRYWKRNIHLTEIHKSSSENEKKKKQRMHEILPLFSCTMQMSTKHLYTEYRILAEPVVSPTNENRVNRWRSVVSLPLRLRRSMETNELNSDWVFSTFSCLDTPKIDHSSKETNDTHRRDAWDLYQWQAFRINWVLVNALDVRRSIRGRHHRTRKQQNGNVSSVAPEDDCSLVSTRDWDISRQAI